NELIEASQRLGKKSQVLNSRAAGQLAVSDIHRTRDELFFAEVQQLQNKLVQIGNRANLLRVEKRIQQELTQSLISKFERSLLLAQRRIVDHELLERNYEAILNSRSRLVQNLTRSVSLQAEMQEIDDRIKIRQKQYLEGLASSVLRSSRERKILLADSERLKILIEKSKIKSKMSGIVTSLPVGDVGGFVTTGSDIAVISEYLEKPSISLRISPLNIDQVYIGQAGRLMLSSFPTRTAPNLNVSVTAVSLEPQEDQKSGESYFVAHAKINLDDLSQAKEVFGTDFRLSVGMPATVLLSGRPTTLARYILDPVLAVWQGAFQE
ncbi:MAG: hypothetical protein AAGD04_08280, partial [Pseudomonadota bacterium]